MINILFEDKFIIVCEKPQGVLSEWHERQKNMPDLLKKQSKAFKISVIHRLAKPVGGVMVFSKHPKATANLAKAVQNHQLTKEYYAVVKGKPQPDSGVFEDILFRDSKNNKSYVVKTLRKGAKPAKLSYKLIDTVDSPEGVLSLVKVKLFTGRTHQIRVQFASRKLPLLGDEKYGGKSAKCDISLWSAHLKFSHPVLFSDIDITLLPPQKYPWNLFKI